MWECVWEVGAEEWMVVGLGNLLGGRLSTILNSGPAGLYALTSFYRPFDQALPHKTHTHTCRFTQAYRAPRKSVEEQPQWHQPNFSILNEERGNANKDEES